MELRMSAYLFVQGHPVAPRCERGAEDWLLGLFRDQVFDFHIPCAAKKSRLLGQEIQSG